MSKGAKRVLGVVAAVAVPFVAAPIAGAIGVSTALGTAAVGAGLGATSAALTGGDPLMGALTGGFGTYAAGGGFDKLFGTQAASAGQQATGGLFGGSGTTAAGTTAAGTTAVAPAAAGTTAAGTTAAAGGLKGFFAKVGQGFLNNPSGAAQLAMTVYGRPPTDLTPAELANLDELRGLAETNRELFEQRVRGANEMIQMAAQNAPNPQQAFAETKIATERQLADQTRGLDANAASLAQRRAAIRSTQTGATAAAAEEERGRRTQAALLQYGYNMLPAEAPRGYAGLALPTYEALQERRDAYTRDLATAAGDLFGGIE